MSETKHSQPASHPGGLANSANIGTPAPLWSQCRDAAIPRLSQAVAMALSYVMGDLTEQAKQARDMNHFRLLEQAKDTLRHGRDGIVTSFQRRFAEFSSAEFSSAEPPSAAEQDRQGLSLMSDSEFHDTSSHDVIAQTICTVCDLELRGISRRFKELAKTAEHAGPVNPLDPDLIGQAVLVAMRERDVSLTLRRLLAPMLAEHLAVTVQILYQDILGLFAGKGGVAAATPGQQFVPEDGIGGTGASRPGETVMQHPSQAARGRAINAALLALTRLQQGKIQLATTVSPDSTAVLHQLADAKFMADIGNSARIALDMVTAMFDGLLADSRIPVAIKTQLGRLQIPVLKVALLDHGFLKRQDHPARQLLQLLATSTGNPGQQTDHTAFEQAVTTLADRITEQFEDNIEIFTEVAQDMQRHLDALHKSTPPTRNVNVAVSSSQPTVNSPDKAAFQQHVRVQARESNLPESVLAFLLDHSETVYRAAYTKPTGNEAALADTDQAMSTLMRSLSPLNWRDSRSSMLSLLPNLLMRLKLGMQAADVSQVAQDSFLAGLAKCHAVVMQAAKELSPSAATDIGLAPAMTPATSQTPVPAPPAMPSTQAESVTVARADQHDAQVRRLQRGTLIEFRQQGGSMTWLKLAWISPNGSIFVFTNKLGERALTINAAALAARFRQDEAQVAMDLTIRGGSTNHLAGRLQNAA